MPTPHIKHMVFRPVPPSCFEASTLYYGMRLKLAVRLPFTCVLVTLIAPCQNEQTRTDRVRADSVNSATAPLVGQNLADNLLAYMDRLEHVDSVETETLRGRLPLHARMLTDVLVQYEREMQIREVSGGRAWQATVDSLRRDLALLPATSDRELRPALLAHQRRVARLIQFHEAMLGRRH